MLNAAGASNHSLLSVNNNSERNFATFFERYNCLSVKHKARFLKQKINKLAETQGGKVSLAILKEIINSENDARGPLNTSTHMVLTTLNSLSAKEMLLIVGSVDIAISVIWTSFAVFKRAGINKKQPIKGFEIAIKNIAGVLGIASLVYFILNQIIGLAVTGNVPNTIFVKTTFGFIVENALLIAALKTYIFRKAIEDLDENTQLADLNKNEKARLAFTSIANFIPDFAALISGIQLFTSFSTDKKALEVVNSKEYLITGFVAPVVLATLLVGYFIVRNTRISTVKEIADKFAKLSAAFSLAYEVAITRNFWQSTEEWEYSKLFISLCIGITAFSVLASAFLKYNLPRSAEHLENDIEQANSDNDSNSDSASAEAIPLLNNPKQRDTVFHGGKFNKLFLLCCPPNTPSTPPQTLSQSQYHSLGSGARPPSPVPQ